MNNDKAIELRNVCRHFGAVRAVDDVCITVRKGEFFSMVGPSGSGKTSCLRLIAGFDRPTSGTILLGDEDVTRVPPYARNVNTVFQDYALFPHLSVSQNVEYGMRMRGVPAAQRRERAAEALGQVALPSFADRRPSQLSGGQRQRVALARAIVNRPSVLLLDEPLGALDMRLREQMQVELKRLHRKLGITFVYVTHDQGEAMSMSDRVAVFADGRIEQVDSPRNLYTTPHTAFVAEFVGGSNVLRGSLAERFGAAHADALSVRPEHVRFVPRGMQSSAEHLTIDGMLVDIQYHGAVSRWEVEVEGRLIIASIPNEDPSQSSAPRVGQQVTLCWPKACVVTVKAGRASK